LTLQFDLPVNATEAPAVVVTQRPKGKRGNQHDLC
jgi:phage tail sheath gpL-like